MLNVCCQFGHLQVEEPDIYEDWRDHLLDDIFLLLHVIVIVNIQFNSESMTTN